MSIVVAVQIRGRPFRHYFKLEVAFVGFPLELYATARRRVDIRPWQVRVLAQTQKQAPCGFQLVNVRRGCSIGIPPIGKRGYRLQLSQNIRQPANGKPCGVAFRYRLIGIVFRLFSATNELLGLRKVR